MTYAPEFASPDLLLQFLVVARDADNKWQKTVARRLNCVDNKAATLENKSQGLASHPSLVSQLLKQDERICVPLLRNVDVPAPQAHVGALYNCGHGLESVHELFHLRARNVVDYPRSGSLPKRRSGLRRGRRRRRGE